MPSVLCSGSIEAADAAAHDAISPVTALSQEKLLRSLEQRLSTQSIKQRLITTTQLDPIMDDEAAMKKLAEVKAKAEQALEDARAAAEKKLAEAKAAAQKTLELVYEGTPPAPDPPATPDPTTAAPCMTNCKCTLDEAMQLVTVVLQNLSEKKKKKDEAVMKLLERMFDPQKNPAPPPNQCFTCLKWCATSGWTPEATSCMACVSAASQSTAVPTMVPWRWWPNSTNSSNIRYQFRYQSRSAEVNFGNGVVGLDFVNREVPLPIGRHNRPLFSALPWR